MAHVVVPTKLLESDAFPPVCVVTGSRDDVSFRRVTLVEETSVAMRGLVGDTGDRLPVLIPFTRRQATLLRWQPLMGLAWIVVCAGVAIVGGVELDLGFGPFLVAIAMLFGFRWWSSTLLPVKLIDYDARVTILDVKRADVAAAIRSHVQSLALPEDLAEEIARKQGASSSMRS